MDNFDDKTPAQPGANDVQEQLDGLRHLVVSVLILLLVVSGTLTIYLLRQWRTVSKELAVVRPQATQMIGDYQKNSVPVMSDFLKKVTDFGRANPDFMPILAKYNIRPNATTGAPPTTAAAPPAAPPKKK
jgi:hypothetical protein